MQLPPKEQIILEADTQLITVTSFEEAKRHLYKIYQDSEWKTVYFGFQFDSSHNITLPSGFPTAKYATRATSTEVEHIVRRRRDDWGRPAA